MQNSTGEHGAVLMLLTGVGSNWRWCFAVPKERAEEDDAEEDDAALDLQPYGQVNPEKTQ